jgi:hypothetical protein
LAFGRYTCTRGRSLSFFRASNRKCAIRWLLFWSNCFQIYPKFRKRPPTTTHNFIFLLRIRLHPVKFLTEMVRKVRVRTTRRSGERMRNVQQGISNAQVFQGHACIPHYPSIFVNRCSLFDIHVIVLNDLTLNVNSALPTSTITELLK